MTFWPEEEEEEEESGQKSVEVTPRLPLGMMSPSTVPPHILELYENSLIGKLGIETNRATQK